VLQGVRPEIAYSESEQASNDGILSSLQGVRAWDQIIIIAFSTNEQASMHPALWPFFPPAVYLHAI
jgi:hypothetical protein